MTKIIITILLLIIVILAIIFRQKSRYILEKLLDGVKKIDKIQDPYKSLIFLMILITM